MADAPSGPCRVEKILCPTDFAPGCAQILAMAAGIAEHFDARVRLLHVCKPDDDRPVDPVTVSPGRRDPLPPHPPPLPLIEDLRTLVNHLPETRRPRVVGEVVGGGVRDTILDNCHALLRPGGELIIFDYNEFSLETLPWYLRVPFKIGECPYAFDFIRQPMAPLLEAHGFSVRQERFFLKGMIRCLRAVRESAS